jgi:hypothetical protein
MRAGGRAAGRCVFARGAAALRCCCCRATASCPPRGGGVGGGGGLCFRWSAAARSISLQSVGPLVPRPPPPLPSVSNPHMLLEHHPSSVGNPHMLLVGLRPYFIFIFIFIFISISTSTPARSARPGAPPPPSAGAARALAVKIKQQLGPGLAWCSAPCTRSGVNCGLGLGRPSPRAISDQQACAPLLG